METGRGCRPPQNNPVLRICWSKISSFSTTMYGYVVQRKSLAFLPAGGTREERTVHEQLELGVVDAYALLQPFREAMARTQWLSGFALHPTNHQNSPPELSRILCHQQPVVYLEAATGATIPEARALPVFIKDYKKTRRQVLKIETVSAIPVLSIGRCATYQYECQVGVGQAAFHEHSDLVGIVAANSKLSRHSSQEAEPKIRFEQKVGSLSAKSST
ncbi:hypothetical protein BDB00DRAFT_926215 [Zychaea mexicana]|uniref:uncharacterized protein n=1 Tax=Zychaea mexicana TaxID=64656 RepID=UPI0022FDCF05|nr:uncharacterized protein BDB00DRAFT_926215 [Zychaea mexicana]KAI9496970.1 hypothetical protein BDB00DRAFT_926215 [Zychaea mexicana]